MANTEKRRGIIGFTREFLDRGYWEYFKRAGCELVEYKGVFEKDCVLAKFDHPKLPVVAEGAKIPNYTDKVRIGIPWHTKADYITIAIEPYFEVNVKSELEPVVVSDGKDPQGKVWSAEEPLKQWVWNN
jgi:hypothetical protein